MVAEIIPEGFQAFMAQEPVATLALAIDEIGTMHAATMRYWATPEMDALFFVTHKDSEKCKLLHIQESLPAAVVIGGYMGATFYVQLRGTVQIVSKQKYRHEIGEYYLKRKNKNDDVDDPNMVLIKYVPTWLRLTDYRAARHTMQLRG